MASDDVARRPGRGALVDRGPAGCAPRAAADRLLGGQPSLLPGWTRGHPARPPGPQRGRDGTSPGRRRPWRAHPDVRQRNARAANIEAGAGRTAAELAADVVDTANRLEQTWSRLDDAQWQHDALTRNGPVPAIRLIGMRWREVEIHRVDLADRYGQRLAAVVRGAAASLAARPAADRPRCRPG